MAVGALCFPWTIHASMHSFMISFVLGLGGGGLDLRAAQWHLVFRRGRAFEEPVCVGLDLGACLVESRECPAELAD